MLSDEERKVMDSLKVISEYAGDNYLAKEHRRKLKLLIELVEKQSKEIEEYKKQLVEKRQFERLNINPNEPLHIIEQRLNARVDAFYRKEIESLRNQLEWYIRNTAVPKMTLPEWRNYDDKSVSKMF